MSFGAGTVASTTISPERRSTPHTMFSLKQHSHSTPSSESALPNGEIAFSPSDFLTT